MFTFRLRFDVQRLGFVLGVRWRFVRLHDLASHFGANPFKQLLANYGGAGAGSSRSSNGDGGGPASRGPASRSAAASKVPPARAGGRGSSSTSGGALAEKPRAASQGGSTGGGAKQLQGGSTRGGAKQQPAGESVLSRIAKATGGGPAKRPQLEEGVGITSGKEEAFLASIKEKVAKLLVIQLDFIDPLAAKGMAELGKFFSSLKREAQGVVNTIVAHTKSAAWSSVSKNAVCADGVIRGRCVLKRSRSRLMFSYAARGVLATGAIGAFVRVVLSVAGVP